MRIRISHDTTYAYQQPVRSILQVLRLTPRSFDGHYVSSWRINLDVNGRIRRSEDMYGNVTHILSVDDPIERMSLSVAGEIETSDTAGIVQGLPERFPPDVYLRSTPLTELDEEMRDFAMEHASGAGTPLDRAHRLMVAINETVKFDTEPTHVATTASEAFQMRRGVCQDLTHVMVACARHTGMPARYVSGYFHRIDGVVDQDAGHAWAELYIDDLGWVGFDPANGISTGPAHARIAAALDYLGAAPVRGSRYGGGEETLDVALHVDAVQRQISNQPQSQNQSQ